MNNTRPNTKIPRVCLRIYVSRKSQEVKICKRYYMQQIYTTNLIKKIFLKILNHLCNNVVGVLNKQPPAKLPKGGYPYVFVLGKAKPAV